MTRDKDERTVALNQKALDRLQRAMRKGESLSDVVIRLSEAKITGLQRRGEKEIVTRDEKSLTVGVDQSRCMGAESCALTAPDVFSVDAKELGGFRRDRTPLGMRDVSEKTVDLDTIVLAAKSCPYHAIYVKDTLTGEMLAD